MSALRVIVVMLLCAALTACSAPSNLKQVTDLSAGFAKVKSSFDSLAEDERQAFIDAQTVVALSPGATLTFAPDCGDVNSRNLSKLDCALVIHQSDGSARKITFDSAVPKGGELAGHLATYGESLVTLATAKDVSDLQDATGKAASAIVKLAVDSKVAAAEPLTSVSTFVVWITDQYLQERRFEQLRSAVRSADPVVAKTAVLLAREANLLQRRIAKHRVNALEADIEKLADLKRDKPKDIDVQRKAADAIVASNVSLQALMKTDVVKPFTKMREAHAELLKALENPQFSSDDVFAKVGDFLDQVEKLKAGIEKGKAGSKS